jgi:hypothetical protein
VLGDLVIVLVPALLGFAAAILGSWLAYRQWKGQRGVERGKSFDRDRAAGYKELWERLEAIHVRLRTASVRDEELDSSLRELNSFILASEIYFDPGIRERARAYVEAVRRVATVIRSYPPELQRDYGMTEDPVVDPGDMKELTEALTSAEESRNALLTEVRGHIGG